MTKEEILRLIRNDLAKIYMLILKNNSDYSKVVCLEEFKQCKNSIYDYCDLLSAQDDKYDYCFVNFEDEDEDDEDVELIRSLPTTIITTDKTTHEFVEILETISLRDYNLKMYMKGEKF